MKRSDFRQQQQQQQQQQTHLNIHGKIVLKLFNSYEQ